MKLERFRSRAFRNAAAFRTWLQKRHKSASNLVVRCYRRRYGHRGITYREALDEALCFGWIDGVRRAHDEASFSVRFTPRKAGSNWSQANTKRALELQAAGRMRPAGHDAFEKRKTASSPRERRPQSLAPSLLKRLRANEKAWRFFEMQPPWYRRITSGWIMSAKRAETRERRFQALLACSAAGLPVPPLRNASIAKKNS